MDKTPFENEDTSSVEPNKLETNHSVIVKTKQIDVLSLPKKDILPPSEKDKKHPPPDEQALDENWLILSRDWQSQPYEKSDIQALLKQTKKRTLWAKASLGLSVVGTVAFLIVFVYGLFQGEFASPRNTYFGVGGGLSLIFVYYEVKIRLQTWAQISESPDQAVENAIVGYQSSLKYMALSKWSCLPFSALANWFVYTMSQESEKSSMPDIIFINIVFATIYVVTDIIHRKRKKEYRELIAHTSNI